MKTTIAAAVEIGIRDVVFRDFIIARLHVERTVHFTRKRVIMKSRMPIPTAVAISDLEQQVRLNLGSKRLAELVYAIHPRVIDMKK